MAENANPRRVLIMGAAGRDFHNFNVAFRNDPAYEVVAFTAAQIPGISGRHIRVHWQANAIRTVSPYSMRSIS